MQALSIEVVQGHANHQAYASHFGLKMTMSVLIGFHLKLEPKNGSMAMTPWLDGLVGVTGFLSYISCFSATFKSPAFTSRESALVAGRSNDDTCHYVFEIIFAASVTSPFYMLLQMRIEKHLQTLRMNT